MEIIKKIYDFRLLKDSIYFKIIFLLWALVHSFGFGANITGYISPILIVWGILLIFKNLILEDIIIDKKYIYIMLSFLILYAITIIYNRNFNLLSNIKSLIWLAIMFFAIFLDGNNKDREKVYRDIKNISKVLTIVIFLVSLVSVLMFCFDIFYKVDRGDGTLIPQGFYAARLWGVYVDPNQGCTIAIMSLISSIILLIMDKNNIVSKVFYIVNIIIQYIFIVLTGSRGGDIAFMFTLIGLIYLVIDFILKNRLKSNIIRKIISVAIGCIIGFIIICSFDSTRLMLGKIPSLTLKTQQIIGNNSKVEIGENLGNITMERPDVGEGKDLSNGRLTLWKDGFRLIKYSPIFGFGDRNIFIKAKELTPGSSLELQYVHNGFIHMLLSGGIVALLVMLLLLSFIAIDIIRVIFGKNKYVKEYYVYSVMSLMIGALLITALFLTELFYQNSIITTVFWVYLGFIVAIDKKDLIKVN